MLKKLRIKFVCTNMVIVMVILIVVFCILIYSTRKNLEYNSIQLLQTVATNAPGSHEPPMRPNFPQKAVRLPYFVLHESMDSNLVVTDGNYYDLSNRKSWPRSRPRRRTWAFFTITICVTTA